MPRAGKKGACHEFQASGTCKYGDKCKFAHGADGEATAAVQKLHIGEQEPRTRSDFAAAQPDRKEKKNADRAVLFVSGLEQCINGTKAKKALQELVQPFGHSKGERTFVRRGAWPTRIALGCAPAVSESGGRAQSLLFARTFGGGG